MSRQIILDTETTGIGAELGHRIIEIGCVEMIDRRLTNNHFHYYLNPQREIDEGAFRVHGISSEFLADKPLFQAIVKDFIQFVDGAELIIHNAGFDIGFLDAELKRCSWPKSMQQHCKVVDTLELARAKHPGQKNNLDALCKRYEIDNSNRQLHGALLDAEILAAVYLAMTGGQASLFDEGQTVSQQATNSTEEIFALSSKTAVLQPSEEELKEHESFVAFLIKKSGINLWQ